MKLFIKKVVPKKFHSMISSLISKHYKRSYSQSGEDMILDTIFCEIRKGTYIDVGANNPTIQSNTYYFYKKGWSGINIDALPGSMKKFNFVRPRDINIEFPISDKEEVLVYYMFSPSLYNTFIEEKSIYHKDTLALHK